MFPKIDNCDTCSNKNVRGTMYVVHEVEHLFICHCCDPQAYKTARSPTCRAFMEEWCGSGTEKLDEALELDEFVASLDDQADVVFTKTGNGVWELEDAPFYLPYT